MRSTASQSSRSRCRASDAARIWRNGDAAARGRGHRDDVVSVVREADRLALDGLVAGEIGLGPDAAHRSHARRQRPGERAAVERVRAAGGDRLERAGKIGLPPRVALRVGRAVGLAEGPQRGGHRLAQRRVGRRAPWRRSRPWCASPWPSRRRGTRRARRRRAPAQSPARRARATAACRTCGARTPGPARRRGCPRRAARRGCRASACRAASRYMSRVAAARRHLAVVDGGAAAVRQPDHHEPAAADVAGGGMGDAERERDGNRGIDRVAAALQDRDADVAGVGLRAGDCAQPPGGDALVALAAGAPGSCPPAGRPPAGDAASSTATDADRFIGGCRPA